MEKLKIAESLRIARNILIIGASVAVVAFLVGSAWHKANPGQPINITIEK